MSRLPRRAPTNVAQQSLDPASAGAGESAVRPPGRRPRHGGERRPARRGGAAARGGASHPRGGDPGRPARPRRLHERPARAQPPIEATLRSLEGFRRIMDSYGVVRYRAVATSAVREAINRDTFLDRVRLRTGIDVEVIDGSEENRLSYMAVREALRDHPALAGGDSLMAEVGGGSADLSFLRKGEPIHSGTYALGAIRMRQNLASWYGSHDQRVRLYRRTVQNIVEDMRREMPMREARFFLALGGDARFVADQVVPADGPRRVRPLRLARELPRLLRRDDGPRRRAARRALPAAAGRGRDARPRAHRLPGAPRGDPGRVGARARGVAAGRPPPRHGAHRAGPRHRGLLAPGPRLRGGPRREVPLRRPARPAGGPPRRRASSTSCTPSTASPSATGSSSRWRRSSTTSASS